MIVEVIMKDVNYKEEEILKKIKMQIKLSKEKLKNYIFICVDNFLL